MRKSPRWFCCSLVDWASKIEGHEELSLRQRGVLWIVLEPARYEDEEEVRGLARKLACSYRERTGHEGEVEVTVWSAAGPGGAWVARESCG